MKRVNSLMAGLVLLCSLPGLTLAQSKPTPAAAAPASAASAAKVVLPPGITEEMLAPPPVPSFMLKPPAKPLTVEQMVQQAREAELKAGIKPAAAASQPAR
ncbi:MAG: hypothetical protein PHH58_07110 [Rhodoferax sp.]|nr:hypothetical protein [Rhodoferax sp.]